MEENNMIIIYTDESGLTRLDVRLEDETLWLTQAQMCELYQTSKSNVSEHIKHIFEEGELQEDAVVRKLRTTAADGKAYLTSFYNLDMIIALGYRVRSIIATRFRQWATQRLREYIVKGFTLDDDRLKQLGGGGYWKELLARIRDIRATEKVLYRQVLEIYATSIDYTHRQELPQRKRTTRIGTTGFGLFRLRGTTGRARATDDHERLGQLSGPNTHYDWRTTTARCRQGDAR